MADNIFPPFNMTVWNIAYCFVKEIGTFRLDLELYTTQHSLRYDFSFYYQLFLSRITPPTASFCFFFHDSFVHTLSTKITLYFSVHMHFDNRYKKCFSNFLFIPPCLSAAYYSHRANSIFPSSCNSVMRVVVIRTW